MFRVFQSISNSPEMVDLEDDQLVGLAQKGDKAAFTELVRRYHRQVLNMLYALVGDSDDADDLAQDIFLKAYRALPGFQGRSRFYTWLYRLSLNCWKDWLKSPKQRKDMWEDLEAYETEFEPRDFLPGTDALVERRELQRLLTRALGDLPFEYRATVVLREIEGFDYEDIALAMDCSVGTVKSRLFRARTRLKKLWETHYRRQWEGAL